MFSYYGSKSKIIDLYPAPKYGKIIEPFAGSARYALKYWDRDVLLVDKYEVIVRIWKWLQQCSTQDILSLPEPMIGEKIVRGDYDCDEQFWFMGFMIGQGLAHPQKSVTNIGLSASGGFANKRKLVSQRVDKIRKWNIQLGDYRDICNQEATWFIDPPYMFGGEHYQENNTNIDYAYLSDWCKLRKGQTIVCENTKAFWLPFIPLVDNAIAMNGKDTTEAIWCNDVTQLKLFADAEKV